MAQSNIRVEISTSPIISYYNGDIGVGRGQLGISAFITIEEAPPDEPVELWEIAPKRPHKYFIKVLEDIPAPLCKFRLPVVGNNLDQAQIGHTIMLVNVGNVAFEIIAGDDVIAELVGGQSIQLAAISNGADGSSWISYGGGGSVGGISSSEALKLVDFGSEEGVDVAAYGLGANAPTVDSIRSLAIGLSAVTSGANTFAFGDESLASGDYSIALGFQSMTSENSALALGRVSEAAGISSVAIGAESLAAGANSIAIGASTAQETNSIAVGNGAYAAEQNSIAVGFNAQATAANSCVLTTDLSGGITGIQPENTFIKVLQNGEMLASSQLGATRLPESLLGPSYPTVRIIQRFQHDVSPGEKTQIADFPLFRRSFVLARIYIIGYTHETLQGNDKSWAFEIITRARCSADLNVVVDDVQISSFGDTESVSVDVEGGNALTVSIEWIGNASDVSHWNTTAHLYEITGPVV